MCTSIPFASLVLHIVPGINSSEDKSPKRQSTSCTEAALFLNAALAQLMAWSWPHHWCLGSTRHKVPLQLEKNFHLDFFSFPFFIRFLQYADHSMKFEVCAYIKLSTSTASPLPMNSSYYEVRFYLQVFFCFHKWPQRHVGSLDLPGCSA